jgi:hypothetical protein
MKKWRQNFWKYRSKKSLPQIALHRYWNSNLRVLQTVSIISSKEVITEE